MNTTVTIAFYRYCRYFMLDPSSCHNAGTVVKAGFNLTHLAG